MDTPKKGTKLVTRSGSIFIVHEIQDDGRFTIFSERTKAVLRMKYCVKDIESGNLTPYMPTPYIEPPAEEE